ncbi:MAG: DUF1294 domain-containing protein [Muribaculaceae bacterium]|nr:DUF1294 domain-containing protein [Muribaculaceae bacterium]
MIGLILFLAFFIMNLLTFALFAWDKHLAVFNKTRIPEAILLLFAFLDGAFGALCAMILFRHKTAHKMFTISVPVFVILQLTVMVLCGLLIG